MDPLERTEALATLDKLLADAAGGGRVALISGKRAPASRRCCPRFAYVEVLARKA